MRVAKRKIEKFPNDIFAEPGVGERSLLACRRRLLPCTSGDEKTDKSVRKSRITMAMEESILNFTAADGVSTIFYPTKVK